MGTNPYKNSDLLTFTEEALSCKTSIFSSVRGIEVHNIVTTQQ